VLKCPVSSPSPALAVPSPERMTGILFLKLLFGITGVFAGPIACIEIGSALLILWPAGRGISLSLLLRFYRDTRSVLPSLCVAGPVLRSLGAWSYRTVALHVFLKVLSNFAVYLPIP
jgi:hypothetical protein